MKNKKIFVAMPSGSGFPYPDTIFGVMYQIVPKGYELVFDMNSLVCGSVVHTARNELVRRFLHSDCDYLRWCDDDNPPNGDVLKYLIQSGKDVCSALVPLRHAGYMLNLFKDGVNITHINDYEDLFEVDNIGTGCVLLTRKVVLDVYEKTLGRPYQFQVVDFVWNTDTNMKEIYRDQDTKEGWEDNYVHIDGIIKKMPGEVGEDLFFGNVAKNLGYKFYADKRARCIHFRGKPEFLSVKNQ